MGYDSRMSGDIEIVPPLTNQEVKKLRLINSEWFEYWSDYHVKAETHEQDLPDGKLVFETARYLEAHDETGKHYEIEETLQALVDAIGPGHVYRGKTLVEGEEQGDIWRVFVRAGRVVRQDAEIAWPDMPPEDQLDT